MDWINEKAEQVRRKVRNLPLKKSLIVYLLFGIFLAYLCSWMTAQICARWADIIAGPYERNGLRLPFEKSTQVELLMSVSYYCPYVYVAVMVVLMGRHFYNKRLKKPTEILKEGTAEIQKRNLDFKMNYDCEDEMGGLCKSFEKMRLEMIADKEDLWKMIEEQKNVNAAFAHDLRTPLTVLKGYSDFLYRYIPEGKISEEKLVGTLKLMSEYIGRLERYSHTMKNIRNFDELEVHQEEISLFRLKEQMQETAEALNRIGDIEITVHCSPKESLLLWVDENIVLEVTDNLLSNAIRYAGEKVDIYLDADENTQMLYLYVRDDGPGFSEEELKKASSPYFGSRKDDKEEHFGIGLHIVTVLSHKCGGTMNLANSIGGGAFVSVSFSYRKF